MTLFNFAYCGAPDYFNEQLYRLSELAEKETWGFDDEDEFVILRRYLYKTFERCYFENKILESKAGAYCCFNTGLLTPKGKDIIMLFEENRNYGTTSTLKWYLDGFFETTDRDYIRLFDRVPDLAKYTDNVEDLFFNPELDIEVNADHIIDDNWERIKDIIKQPKDIAELILIGALDKAVRKAKRNMRLVIPQYYDGKINFLLPIEIPTGTDGKTRNYLVLAIEKTPYKYRANTVFDIRTAYEKARVLMKIEDNWLKIFK